MTEMTEMNEVEASSEVVSVCDMEDPGDGSISVIAKKNGKSAQIFYNFGSDLETMVELFGGPVVFSQARAQMKIKLQSGMRSYLEANRDVKELVTKYVPGVALERLPTDMNAATENYFATLSEDEQDAMIAKLLESKTGN